MSQSVHQKGVYCGMRVLALFLAYVERELAIGSNLHNDTSSWFQISLRSEVAGDPWRDCSRDEESALLPTGSWLVENLNEVIDLTHGHRVGYGVHSLPGHEHDTAIVAQVEI